MDYCTSCLRELNGVVSCPGCGTSVDSMPQAQASPSGVQMRQSAGGRQDPLAMPTVANRGVGMAATAPTRTDLGRGRVSDRARTHAAARSMLYGGTTPAESEFVPHGGSAAGAAGRHRHSHRRRSLARRVTTTGGFAGIAVIGSLALSNLSTATRDSAAPTGSVAITSTLAQPGSHSATTNLATSPKTQTPASTKPSSISSPTPASSSSAAIPTSQSSPGTSHYAPRHALRSTTSSTSSTGVQSSPTATPSTTQPSAAPSSASSSSTPAPAPTPSSSSPTQSSSSGPVCILVLCL